MSSGRLAITGMGVLSAAGVGVDATREALRAGRSGLGPLTQLQSERCGHFPVAQVAMQSKGSRSFALAEVACAQALRDAGLASVETGRATNEEAGLCVGTCVGGMPESEIALRALVHEEPFDASVWERHECGALTAAVARRFELRGPSLTLSTACSSGAQAIADGAELVLAGAAPWVVAGGADALCHLTLNGFASLLAMDPEGCRPFDAKRGGMSLGEGAAFCVLEDEAHAAARGARPIAWLEGWANSCDAFHATAPEPDGRGAEAALRGALARAGREARQVDYVNAHGTGTRENDRAEGRALGRVFAERMPPISSTKRVFGHTLAAAGAIEAVVCALALRDGFLPSNPGCSEPDPECGVTPVASAREAALELALSSSFGFGGNNTVLCFARGEDEA